MIYLAIPKLKLRRKSASETIKPIFQELGSIMDLSVHNATMNEARSLLSNVINLARRTAEWNQEVNNSNEVDKEACRALLGRLLGTSISACEHQVQSDIAQRTLEKCYPRFAFRSQVRPDSEAGKRIMFDVLVSFCLLSTSYPYIFTGCSKISWNAGAYYRSSSYSVSTIPRRQSTCNLIASPSCADIIHTFKQVSGRISGYLN